MKNKKYLIFGGSGQLGTEFTNYFEKGNYDYYTPGEEMSDVTNFSMVNAIVADYAPDVIINCAAFNAVDIAEDQPEIANAVNHLSVRNLSEVCKKNTIKLIHYSSDYVFDGNKQDIYGEDDSPNPQNIYGKSKLDGEKAILEIMDNYLIFRLSWVIGPGKQNFLHKLNNWAGKNRVLKISSDEVSVPTFTFDIVKYTLLSIEKNLNGLYHMVSTGYASRYELARNFVKERNLSNIIIPVPVNTFNTKAKRPLFSVMSNHKLSNELDTSIGTWEESLRIYMGNYSFM